jgi:hypothetical protein
MFSWNSQAFTMASFRTFYTSLMLVIAGSTQKELARQVSYLKAENRILRSRLPERMILTQREKNRFSGGGLIGNGNGACRLAFLDDRCGGRVGFGDLFPCVSRVQRGQRREQQGGDEC